MNVQSSAGMASGKMVADLLAPGQSVAGRPVGPASRSRRRCSTIRSRRATSPRTRASTCTARRCRTSTSLRGTVSLDSPRAGRRRLCRGAHPRQRAASTAGRSRSTAAPSAYGASATVAGNVTLPDFDRKRPRGRLRRARPGRASRSAQAAARAEGAAGGDRRQRRLSRHGRRRQRRRDAGSDVDLRFEPSTVAGARIAGGSTAGVTVDGGRCRIAPTRPSRISICSRSASSSACRRSPTDRYTSTINGHIIASGRGTTPRDDGRDGERHADRHVDPRRHDSAADLRRRRRATTRRT